MKGKFTKIIYNWVKEYYGVSEADDPSWNIKALADELSKHFHELYEKQEREYIAEDVEYVAGLMNRKLTKKQISAVTDKYYYSESYGACDTDAIKWFIDQYAGE